MNGAWGDAGMWSCTPAPSLSTTDTIIIAHAITNSSMSISGTTVLIIQATSSLTVSGTFETVSEDAKIEVYGTLSSSGTFTAEGGSVNIHNGGIVNVTGAGSDYIIKKGNGGGGDTSVTNIYSGGTLNVADAITFEAGASTLNAYDGSTINAASIAVAGGSTDTPALFGGTVNLTGAFTTGSAARRLDITGTVNAASFTTAQATVSLTGTMNLTGDFTSTGGAFVDFTGTVNARDMLISGGGTFSGTPTLNLRDLRLGWSNTPYGSGLNYSGTTNFTGGTITLSRHLATAGGALVTIGANISIDSNFYAGGGNGIIFNGTTQIDGDIYKTGSGPITANNTFIVNGTLDLRNGGSAADLLVAANVQFEARRMLVTGNFNTVVNGSFNIIEDIRMGTSSTDSSTSVGGSVTITGSGVVAWDPGRLFTNGSAGTYIGCTNGNLYGDGPLAAYPDPPANPLDLSTCGPGVVLSVSFASFEGSFSNGAVYLSWSTASELNNDRFFIERNDGTGFYSVGSVSGSGTSNDLKYYMYSYDGSGGYFRIKQVDFDGQFSYSNVLYIESEESTYFNIYPNPVEGNSFHINYAGLGENVIVSVRSMAGSLIIQKELSKSERFVDIQRVKDMLSGIYLVEVRSSSGVFYEKLFLK